MIEKTYSLGSSRKTAASGFSLSLRSIASGRRSAKRVAEAVLAGLLAVGVVGQRQRVVEVGHEGGQRVRLLQDLGLVACLEGLHQPRVGLLDEPGQAPHLLGPSPKRSSAARPRCGESPAKGKGSRRSIGEAPLGTFLGRARVSGRASASRAGGSCRRPSGARQARRWLEQSRPGGRRCRRPGPRRRPRPEGRAAPPPARDCTVANAVVTLYLTLSPTKSPRRPSDHPGRGQQAHLGRRPPRAAPARRPAPWRPSSARRRPATTTRPATGPRRRTAKAPPTFARRAAAESPVWGGVSLRRTRAPGGHQEPGAPAELRGQQLRLVEAALARAARGWSGTGTRTSPPSSTARTGSSRRAAPRRGGGDPPPPRYLSSWITARRPPS